MTRTQFGKLTKSLLGWMGYPGTGRTEDQVIYFERTVNVALVDGVSVIADSEVPYGFKAYVTDYVIDVTTAYADGTAMVISDTNGTPVDFATIAVAGLTLNALLRPTSSNTTLGNAFRRRTGGTASKGLQIRLTGTHSAGAAVVTVSGYYKSTTLP